MKSRLVLGASSFKFLSQSDVNALIGTAQECGIRRIDTAHGYERSEEMIGQFLKTNRDLQINTKVGLPDPTSFTPRGIRMSVEESLRRLGVENISTLFVHSLEAKYLTDENIKAMVTLKEQGKVTRIGYSGDGDNLAFAIESLAFDDFMATFNIIDQSNAEQFKKLTNGSDIYYKLAMGQAIWTSLEWRRRVKSHKIIRFLFNKPAVPESWSDYCTRFNSFKSEIDGSDFAREFLRFALFSGSSSQFVILGTSSPKHIQDAIKIESEQLDADSIEITRYEELWLKKSSSEWKAHVG